MSAITAPVRQVPYRMVAGDSLYALARLYFVNFAAVAKVQRLNHIANPHRIATARIITIPVDVLRAEPLTAQLVAARGDVRLVQAGRVLPARAGLAVEPGWTLVTGADGFATIELPNGSRTSLPTRSRLTIRTLRRFLLTRSFDFELEVGDGKAETEATPIPPGTGEFRIRTPRAVSAVRGTRFRVGYAPGQSATEVLEGKVAFGFGSQTTDAVTKGYGVAISDSGTITMEHLLPAPELLRPGRVQVDPLVTLGFAPVAGAASYHVQIAQDAGFTHIIAEWQGRQPRASFANIANGSYFVRATAIGASGLEGMQQSYAMRRVLSALGASASGDADVMRFRWSGAGDGARVYRFQMARGAATAAPVIDEPGLGPQGLDLTHLAPGVYYWRVGVARLAADGRVENWTPFERLTIAAPEQ